MASLFLQSLRKSCHDGTTLFRKLN